MKKVLTIVVTYNGLKWLDLCFSSLRNSEYPTDVIVIDNNSSDDTVPYLKKKFSEVAIIESSTNLGFGKANNKGISYGMIKNYDFIFLLNQDAWVFPDTIGKLIKNFKTHPEFGIISPVQLQKNLHLEEIFKSYIKNIELLNRNFEPHIKHKEAVYEVDFVNAAAWMIPLQTIKKVGGFSPLFSHYGEDADYVNRMRYFGFHTGVSGNAFAVHDRNIKTSVSVKEHNKRKKHPGPWPLKYYVLLSNINYSFLNVLIKCFRLFLTSLIRHLAGGNWFSVKYDFIVLAVVIKKMPFIHSLRKRLMKGDGLFID